MSLKKVIDVNTRYKVSYGFLEKETTLFDTSDIYIVFCKKGSGDIFINNDKYIYKENTAFVALFTDHCIVSPHETSEVFVFEFSFDIIDSDFGKIVPIDSFPAEITVEAYDKATIENLIDMILEERDISDEYSEIYFSGVFEQIIVCLLSNMPVSQISNPKIRKAIAYIYENFRTNITKEEIADISDISYQSFGSEFYKYMGMHFKEYLNNIRLNYSMKLIRCTDMNFTDICYECGFNSSQYFSHMFKEYFGVSPKNIRKDSDE